MRSFTDTFRFVKAVAVATYKEWAAYRTHSMVSVFVGPARFLVQVAIWTAVYSQGGSVGGLSLEEMIAYFAVTTLISYLIMDFADWNLQMLIHTGKYLTFALRPMHHRAFALAQKIGHRTLGFLFEFLPVLGLYLLLFDVNLAPHNWAWTVLSIGLGFLMQFYINYCIGLSGFWLVRTNGLRSIIHLMTSVCSGALFPLAMLPGAAQALLRLLPFQYTLYVPSMIWIGGYPAPQTVLLAQAAYVAVLILVSELLYRLGMKRFTAVGA